MKIPEDKIDEVRSATDIVDLVGSYVKLKKRGKNYLGLCPFHTEKTPSFNVSADRQMYHCFGCGAGGNVFTFLMEFEKVSFVEAVRSLAKTAGIELPAPGTSPGETGPTEQDRAHELYRMAGQYYYRNLTSTQEGKLALEYLHHRGMEDGTITRFGLGYAMNSWDAFLVHAREQGYDPAFLEKYGLVRRRDDGSYYDYFRGRVLFPVFTAAGRTVGFGARKLREDDPLGKYINSPETPVYSKGRILYGLAQSREQIREKDFAILVEGYMDLLTLYQAGIQNVIASSGTALTPEQVQLLARYSGNLTIVFDADSAGARAAMRGAETALEQDLDVRIVRLPQGTDPDAFLRERGVNEFRTLCAESLSFVDDFVEGNRDSLGAPEGKTRLVRELVRVMARMPDALKRDFFVKHIAEKFGLRESVVQAELQASMRRTPNVARATRPPQEGGATPVPRSQAPPPTGTVPPEESMMLSAVLRGGEDVARFVFSHLRPSDFSHPIAKGLAASISARLEEGEPIDATSLVSIAGDAAMRDFISEIVFTKYELSRGFRESGVSAEQGDPLRIAQDTLLAMKKKTLMSEKRDNQRKIRELSSRGGDVLPYLRKITLLDEEIRKLEKGEGGPDSPAEA